MGFMIPLFLVGTGLVVVPWIVHRIRRPEREEVQFSSLMFMPEMKREVIEHRRVQHPLLMMLRMLLLVLLALAFTRPYRSITPGAMTQDSADSIHVILIDTSMSMSRPGALAQAKQRATQILADLPADTRVGVVAFARSAQILVPVSGEASQTWGTVASARRAIEAVDATWEETDFEQALQAAEQMLLESRREDTRKVIHLISDFQLTGMPQHESLSASWQLSPGIELAPVTIDAAASANYAVEALVVQRLNEQAFRVRARIKNWSESDRSPITADLVVGDRIVESQTLTVLPGHATLLRFTFRGDDIAGFGGYVELAADDLLADNRRYFAWNPPYRAQISLVKESARRVSWSYDRLIYAALGSSQDAPWDVSMIAADEFALGSAEVAILAGVPPKSLDSLTDYIRNGGQLLLVPHSETAPDALNRLLRAFGTEVLGTAFDHTREDQFTSISWVDLEHPIFHPFQGARFNDFSTLRFHNYFRLRANEEAQVIARFDNGDPAMVTLSLGEGRLVLWLGGVELDWTNLAKRPRFLPLLHETLSFLVGETHESTEYSVGTRLTHTMAEHHATVTEDAVLTSATGNHRVRTLLDQPGLLRWSGTSGQGRLAAVNVASRESDPAGIDPTELEIRFTDPAMPAQTQAMSTGMNSLQARIARLEYGRWILGCVLVLLLVESGYAVWLALKSERGNRV